MRSLTDGAVRLKRRIQSHTAELPLSASTLDAVSCTVGYHGRRCFWTPAVTLMTFLRQILHGNCACRQAVAMTLDGSRQPSWYRLLAEIRQTNGPLGKPLRTCFARGNFGGQARSGGNHLLSPRRSFPPHPFLADPTTVPLWHPRGPGLRLDTRALTNKTDLIEVTSLFDPVLSMPYSRKRYALSFR